MGTHHPGRGQNLRDLQRAVKQMVTQAVQNASFGSAGLRVYDGGWINIENGGLRVIGTAIIEGILKGTGTLEWLGPWLLKGKGTISGDTDITGALGIKGKTSITGDTDITGKLKATGDAEFGGDTTIKKNLDVQAKTRLRGETTLEDDLKVLPGGKIQVGDMIIDPAGAGKITFANGTEVRAGEGGVTIANGVSNVTVAPGFTRIGVGGSAVYVDGTGIFLNTVPQVFHPDLPKGTLMRQGGRIVEVAG